MALETVVYAQDLFSYGCKDLYSLAAALSYDFKAEEQDDEEEREGAVECGMSFPTVRNPELGRGLDVLHGNLKEWDANSSPEASTPDGLLSGNFPAPETTPAAGRRKRRRAKSCKNKEEVENQRMTHIAVERNRRKQMNEYLAVLRSLMPPSYVQRVCFSLSNFLSLAFSLSFKSMISLLICYKEYSSFTLSFSHFFIHHSKVGCLYQSFSKSIVAIMRFICPTCLSLHF